MTTRLLRKPAAKTPARSVRKAAPAKLPPPKRPQRIQTEYVLIEDIVPYVYNARDNADAIPVVRRSIEQFGFLVPCVIDADNNLITGHTRIEAAKGLGYTEVPCIRASYLTEEQVKQFRLIDNKTSEIATWDNELLAREVGDILGVDPNFDFTAFGWTQEAIDCLSDAVTEDCLEAAEAANEQVAQQANVRERRAPATARIVIGEVVFFVPAAVYRSWIDGIRQLHDFNDTAIITDLKRRLGIQE